jgi:chaperonin GroES
MSTLRPVGDRVAVKIIKADEVNPAGLIVVHKEDLKQQRGTITAIGVGGTTDQGQPKPMLLKVGEVVVVDLDFGAKVELDGDTFYVFQQDNVIAIVE